MTEEEQPAAVTFNPGLSKVSRAYDRGNKGYLDETEKKLRDMDSQNLGHLDNDKVYQIMEDLMSEHKKAMNLKKLSIALAVFAVLLCLANIGTAFAAAKLAQDSKVQNNVLVTTADGSIVGVAEMATIYEDLQPVYETEDGRQLIGKPRSRALENDDTFRVEGVPGHFRMREAAVNNLMKDLCNEWKDMSKADDDDDDDKNNNNNNDDFKDNFQCSSRKKTAVIKACGVDTEVQIQRDPHRNDGSNKVNIFLYGCNAGTCDNDVRITCDLDKNIDYNCDVFGLSCHVLCNKCTNNDPNGARSTSWRCDSQEQCGCAPKSCEAQNVELSCPSGCFDYDASWI